MSSDRTLQTPSWSSGGQRSSERSTGSGTSSGRSSHLLWRERLLIGAETSSESSGTGTAGEEIKTTDGRGNNVRKIKLCPLGLNTVSRIDPKDDLTVFA